MADEGDGFGAGDAALAAAGVVPVAGEIVDVYTILAPDSTWLDVGASVASLGVNAFTLGFAPNFGGIFKAGRKAVGAVAENTSEVKGAVNTAEGVTGAGAKQADGTGGVLVTEKKAAGRRGSEETRADIDAQRDKILEEHPDWDHTHGGTDQVTGAPKPELYVPGADGKPKGSTYPDLTFKKPDGTNHHHNTVDTYADRVTPTKREAANADRLQTLRPQDTVTTSPKPKPQ